MDLFLIYIWSISDSIKGVAILIATFALILAGAGLFFVFCSPCDPNDCGGCEPTHCLIKRVEQMKGYAFKLGIVFCLLSALIPSKQDLALIALYPLIKNGAITTVKSTTVQKLVNLTNTYLDTQTAELLKGNK